VDVLCDRVHYSSHCDPRYRYIFTHAYGCMPLCDMGIYAGFTEPVGTGPVRPVPGGTGPARYMNRSGSHSKTVPVI
jgi:hypothetical protein